MIKRLFILLLAGLAAGPVAAADKGEAALWSALRDGGYIVFIRHAITEPGIGDPPGFKLGECSTQRNLSTQGRADARRVGNAFRARRVPIQDVLSSRWCRCVETAQLAFERVTPAPMLDSMFGEEESGRQIKQQQLYNWLAKNPVNGSNVVMVTHAQNIQELTGVSPASGEMVVTKFSAPDKLKVVGRLGVPGS